VSQQLALRPVSNQDVRVSPAVAPPPPPATAILTRPATATPVPRPDLDRPRKGGAANRASYDQGQVLLESGDQAAAMQAFRNYLLHAPPGARRTRAEALAQALRPQVGELTVLGRAGSTISIDGRRYGRAPLPGSIFVAPGPHVLVATSKTGAAVEVPFTVKAGTHVAIETRPASQAAGDVK
jgi:hypothetical protein